ncbi:MAG: helix-turn-helix transcriptional regulator [Nitrospirota bacterium]
MKIKSASIKQQVGLRIKHVRKTRGLSQEKLSEKVAMSSKYLSSIERGKENPTLDTFIKLAQALNVEISELFNYAGEKSVQESKKYLLDLMKGSDKEKLDLAVKMLRALYL